MSVYVQDTQEPETVIMTNLTNLGEEWTVTHYIDEIDPGCYMFNAKHEQNVGCIIGNRVLRLSQANFDQWEEAEKRYKRISDICALISSGIIPLILTLLLAAPLILMGPVDKVYEVLILLVSILGIYTWTFWWWVPRTLKKSRDKKETLQTLLLQEFYPGMEFREAKENLILPLRTT